LIDVFATAVRGRVFMEGGFVLVHAAIAANPESVEVVDSGCCAIYALAGDPGENGCVERIVHTSGPHLHVNSLFCCLADTRAPLFQAGALDDVIAALLQFPDDKLLQNNGVLALGWLAGEPSVMLSLKMCGPACRGSVADKGLPVLTKAMKAYPDDAGLLSSVFYCFEALCGEPGQSYHHRVMCAVSYCGYSRSKSSKDHQGRVWRPTSDETSNDFFSH
jgi:hypothetical protein